MPSNLTHRLLPGPISLLAVLAACSGCEASTVDADEVVGTAADPTHCALPDPADLFQWTTQEKLTGFSHTADLYATERFRAGTSAPLPSVAMPAVTYRYAGKTRNVDDYMRREKVAGLLVLKDGKIALERYAAGIDEHTLWESKSVGKSIVSTLIGVALAEGKIGSLDDAVDDPRYIPELHDTAYHGVTIRNMLRMASGVAWIEEPYDDPASDANVLLSDCIANRKAGCTFDHMSHLARAVDPATGQPVQQGTVWNYNTGEAFLTGMLLERATGRSIAQYLQEKIWIPAGMESDGRWILESNGGQTFGGIGFNATLRDYGRMGLFVMNNGVLAGGAHVLPTDWVKDATTWTAPSSLADYADNGQYGYMWWFSPAYNDFINNASPLKTKTGPVPLQNTTAPTAKKLTNRTSDWTFCAIGIFGQLISINQLEHLVVVEWATWDDPDPVDAVEFPDQPYNEQSVFIDAVTDALH